MTEDEEFDALEQRLNFNRTHENGEPVEMVRWVSAGTLFGLKRNKDKKTHVLYGEKTKVARIKVSIKVIL